jgi:predicted methyltransferase
MVRKPIILSYVQVEPVLEALKSRKKSVVTSLDLGLSAVQVKLGEGGVVFSDGQKVDWESLQKVVKHKSRCYLVEEGGVRPVVVHSKETGWVRTLYPTGGAPTTLVSGILMHRIKNVDPIEDTMGKIRTLGDLREAVVLDTATGLGYTAIEVAKLAKRVITVELDPTALEIARLNPWSDRLFEESKIICVVGDMREEVKKFKMGQLTHIIHDPPTMKIAGELYSGELYEDFYRVLGRKGKLFHYIGDPESKHGLRVTKGVVRRLREAGFPRVERRPEAFGVVAEKRRW